VADEMTTKLRLSIASVISDRNRPLIDGTVQIDGSTRS
jgi:hypothetical protein